MTPQEAIERLKAQMIVEQNRKPITDGGKIDRRENVKSLNMAISALEKQMPKKIETNTHYLEDKFCPECYENFTGLDCLLESGKKYEFCPACGQALDWGEEE